MCTAYIQTEGAGENQASQTTTPYPFQAIRDIQPSSVVVLLSNEGCPSVQFYCSFLHVHSILDSTLKAHLLCSRSSVPTRAVLS